MSDVVDRVLDALNARDIDAFVACYADDATIENGYDEVGARGHDGAARALRADVRAVPGHSREPLSREPKPAPFVVQHEEVTGRGEPARHVAVYLVARRPIARERLLA